MFEFLLAALSPLNVLLALGGVVAGTVIGAIPGLTATMAVAVLAPLTFAMDPGSALILLGAIYTGAIYGGAYSAILLNTPGTPSAIATTFDGYAMARRGDGDLAVSVACLASVGGGLVGALALAVFAPPLAQAALAFGPVEYFWLAIFGLSLIAALSEGDPLKGAIGACFGLLLSTIGVAEISGQVRFTFGTATLVGGVEVVSALIGLFCIPVLMELAANPGRHLDAPVQGRGFRLPEAWGALLRNKWNLLRSSALGTMVGALPGAGGSIASLIAYSEGRRAGRNPDDWGKGEPGGVVASESANNATVGGGFIPTLVLGVPGTPPDAVILGALMVQGVRVGPALFQDSGGAVYTFIAGLFIATVLMLPVGLLIGRFAYGAIVRAPKAALVPVVAFMTLIGAFAIRNSLTDVAMMIVLGVVGWLAARRGFAVSPIVLGLILGRIAEEGFVQAWTIGDALGDLPGQFFGRPISLVIIALTVLTLVVGLAPALRRRSPADKVAALPSGPALPEALGLAAAAGVGAVFLHQSGALNAEASAFPRTIAIAMLILCALAALRLALLGAPPAARREGDGWRRAATPVIMLGGVGAAGVIGFGAAGVVMALALMPVAAGAAMGRRAGLVTALGVVAVVAAFTFGFRDLLGVPLPRPAF